MPAVHRVGDTDSDRDRAVTGSRNVFANGGPSSGGALADALGLSDVLVSEETATNVLEGMQETQQLGFNPLHNDPLDNGGGNVGGYDPVTGSSGTIYEPGSREAEVAARAGVPLVDDNGNPIAGGSSSPNAEYPAPRELINWAPGVDRRITQEMGEMVEAIARRWGRQITITSGYRDPGRNRDAGGVRGSLHMQGRAVDISTRGLSDQEWFQFIRAAAAENIGGIGIYNPSSSGGVFMHLDLGGKRCWGPNTSYTSLSWDGHSQFIPVLDELGYYPNI